MRSVFARFRKPIELTRSIEIAADGPQVFGQWSRLQELPVLMESVRRIKPIDERRSLWDVDVVGHQVVWEAWIVERIPEKLIRWESRWGAQQRGEVRFDSLARGRTRLTIEIEVRPRGFLEFIALRTGLVGLLVERDLTGFRRFLERAAREEAQPLRTPARARR